MSKQDGYSPRSAVDLERKYNFGKTFAEVYNLVTDAQRAAQEAQNAFDGLTQEQIFNLLTNYGKAQGIYRDDNGDVYVNASYIKSGKLAAQYIDATDLKVDAANITGTLKVGQMPYGIAMLSDIPTDYVTESNVTTIVNGIVTTDYLYALGVSATELRGTTVGLYTGMGAAAGGLDITGASTSDYAVELYSNGALRLMAYGDWASAYMGAGGAAVGVQEVDTDGYKITVSTDIQPDGNGYAYCGRYYYRWAGVYSTTEVNVSSDRNLKHSISYDLDRYDAFFDKLQPVIYKLNNGTSGRYHVGMIAQDVEQSMGECGLDSTEFGGFCKEGEEYSLRYGEFISLLIRQVQQLKGRVAELEGKI